MYTYEEYRELLAELEERTKDVREILSRADDRIPEYPEIMPADMEKSLEHIKLLPRLHELKLKMEKQFEDNIKKVTTEDIENVLSHLINTKSS